MEHVLFKSGSTGATNSAKVGGLIKEDVALEVEVEAVGATPTISMRLQGSMNGDDWVDVSTINSENSGSGITQTITTVRTNIYFINNSAQEVFFNYYRLAVTANTNVTFRASLHTRAAD